MLPSMYRLMILILILYDCEDETLQVKFSAEKVKSEGDGR